MMTLLKIAKWSAAHLAWMTMVISPVAYGKEAEKISKQKLAQYIQEFGLDKRTTLGEFWQKSKAYYPGYVYKELELFVNQNKNLEMPLMTVASAQATGGDDVPVLQISQNGKTQAVQFYGDANKWAKFNNTNLSAADLERPGDIFKRVSANDIRVKKEFDSLQDKFAASLQGKVTTTNIQVKDLSRFQGFPRVTPELWKSLTMEQRANYLIKMRLMYMSALEVTRTLTPKKPTRTFFDLLRGEEAFAQSSVAKPTVSTKKLVRAAIAFKNTVVKTRSGKSVSIPDSAKACIVAGYVGAEGIGSNFNGPARKVCSLDIALGLYEGTNAPGYVREANNNCITKNGNNSRACNPMQYGFPQGEALCIDQSKIEFQEATVRNGACDSASPLSSANLVLDFNGKNYDHIMPDSVRHKKIEEDQRSAEFKYTKDFVEGLVKHGDKDRSKKLLDMFQKGVWDEDLDKELVTIQSVYEEETNRAIKACLENVEKAHVDKKQKPACDQLHRRWLFTEKFISEIRSKACPADSKYIGAYEKDESMTESAVVAKTADGKDLTKTELNKQQLTDPKGKGLCKCADGSTADFGGPCAKAPVVPFVLTEPAKEPEIIDKKLCPAGTRGIPGDSNQCQCADDEEKVISVTTPPEDVAKLCEKSDWWKWLLGGLGILALFALFNRHKKPKQPEPPPATPPAQQCTAPKVGTPPNCACPTACAPNQVQNPESCACSATPPPQLCPAPKVGTPPNCACPATNSCTPGQQIYNQVTCQCDTVVQPVICPNGSSAPNNNLTQCPKCSDGSYAPVGGCPPPSEGGSGNNCPGGNCNGGGPPKTKVTK